MRSCQFPACQAQAMDYCCVWYLDNPKEKLSIDSAHRSPYQIILGAFQDVPGTGSSTQPWYAVKPNLSCSDYQVVGTMHPLGSFVHFKLAFLLICLISVTLWDIPTTNNGWTRCVCVCTKEHHTKETPFSRWRPRQTKGRTIEQEDWHFWCKMYHENIFQQLAEKVIFNHNYKNRTIKLRWAGFWYCNASPFFFWSHIRMTCWNVKTGREEKQVINGKV